MNSMFLVRNNSNDQVISKSNLYNNLGIEEYSLCQDNLSDLTFVNSISPKAKISKLGCDELFDFFKRLTGCESLGYTAWDILQDGYWEAFNDGYDAVTYSSISVLKYKEIYIASEVYSDEAFSFADRSMFEYMVENQIDDIQNIYLDFRL